ncbi:MAG: prepilin-type N-terminal cleavage/methylation domain-containing protein [Lachnospiraceae bacterium]|nr:prepilin-type N-terminal cleavage/methylation domain-containing protein [Lachnospiraceae bacterium]
MRKNNSGMTIVEIVVVVAILAILAGTGLYGIGQLGGFRAREGADTIYNSLMEARIATLGKAKSTGNIAWELYEKDGSFYVRTVYDADGTPYYRDEQKIVDGKVTVSTGQKNGAAVSVAEMASGETYRVYFNRSTGAACAADGATLALNPYIVVKYGAKDYGVEIVAKTGKIISDTVKK